MRSKQAFEIDHDTAGRVLSAAESLFATKGLEKSSLRELTARAGVNLAAVNYHFGSKEGLAEAVFERLAGRINDRRLADLEACLAQARSEQRLPRLDDILSIFIQPYLEPDEQSGGLLLARFILQHRLQPSPLTKRIIRKHFDPLARRCVEALALACPDVDPLEFYWRYIFMIGAVVLTVTDSSNDNRVRGLSKGKFDARNRDELRRALMRFLHGGMAA